MTNLSIARNVEALKYLNRKITKKSSNFISWEAYAKPRGRRGKSLSIRDLKKKIIYVREFIIRKLLHLT